MAALLAGDAATVHDAEYVTTLFHADRAFIRRGPWKLVTLEPRRSGSWPVAHGMSRRALARSAMEAPRRGGYLHSMDSEMHAAITALSDTMSAGFARMDRYFELSQKQFLEWRAELRGEVGES